MVAASWSPGAERRQSVGAGEPESQQALVDRPARKALVRKCWRNAPALLRLFATHYETGEPLPQPLLDGLEPRPHFDQGSLTLESLATAYLDIELHLLPGGTQDPLEFEKRILGELGLPSCLARRHRLCNSRHLFSPFSTPGTYYRYLWARVLSADGFEAFLEGKEPLDTEAAQRLFDHVLSVGNTIDPMLGYERFRGRGPSADALLRKLGPDAAQMQSS